MLLTNLRQYGVCGITNDWLSSYLENMLQLYNDSTLICHLQCTQRFNFI